MSDCDLDSDEDEICCNVLDMVEGEHDSLWEVLYKADTKVWEICMEDRWENDACSEEEEGQWTKRVWETCMEKLDNDLHETSFYNYGVDEYKRDKYCFYGNSI